MEPNPAARMIQRWFSNQKSKVANQKLIEPLAGLFHRLTPGSFQSLKGIERTGPLDLLRVQGFEMVRASGNAPEPGTDLVRCGV